MSFLYSASTPGFYHTDIHGEAIPADAVEISDEEHRALLDQQATGLEIRPGPNGRPMATTPEPSAEELTNRLRIRRNALLRRGLVRCSQNSIPALASRIPTARR